MPNKVRLHWLGWQPTPYNDTLFKAIMADPAIDLNVHYARKLYASHPWKIELAKDYNSDYLRTFGGVDWRIVLLPLRQKNSFWVIASWVHPTAILLIALLSLMGRPFALWTDTPNLERRRNPGFAFLRSRWLRWVFQGAHKVMATGQPGVEALRSMGVPKSKLVNLPFFLDLAKYERRVQDKYDCKTHALRFLSSGRINNMIKGHDIAVRALAQVSEKDTNLNFEYYIAGTGPDELILRELVDELGLNGKVKYLGWLEPDELCKCLLDADVLIHPSPTHDPFPIAVLEGMAAGMVVLASDVSGSALDRIDNGTNGFIHPAGNIQTLAEQIEFLLNNTEECSEIGRRARATAEQWPVERGVSIINGVLAVSSPKALGSG